MPGSYITAHCKLWANISGNAFSNINCKKIEKEEHGKVYDPHFAYLIAVFTDTYFRNVQFLVGAGIFLALLIRILLLFYPCQQNQIIVNLHNQS